MSLYFSLIYFLSCDNCKWSCNSVKKKKGSEWREKSWDVKPKNKDGLWFALLLRDQYVCMFPFTRAWLFCFGDYIHHGTNDRNITISKHDYREDDRRSEWERGRGNSCVSSFRFGMKLCCLLDWNEDVSRVWLADWRPHSLHFEH